MCCPTFTDWPICCPRSWLSSSRRLGSWRPGPSSSRTQQNIGRRRLRRGRPLPFLPPAPTGGPRAALHSRRGRARPADPPAACLRVYAELFRRPDFNSTERGDHEGFELVIESLGCCQEGRVIVDRDERRGNDVGDGASAVWASLNNSSIGTNSPAAGPPRWPRRSCCSELGEDGSTPGSTRGKTHHPSSKPAWVSLPLYPSYSANTARVGKAKREVTIAPYRWRDRPTTCHRL